MLAQLGLARNRVGGVARLNHVFQAGLDHAQGLWVGVDIELAGLNGVEHQLRRVRRRDPP